MKNWKLWFKGLVAAVIGGAANAVVAIGVMPETFNFSGDGFLNILKIAGGGAFVAFWFYLKQSPLPPNGLPAGTKATLTGVLLLLLLGLEVACIRPEYDRVRHPGAVDAFDSQIYDVLLVSQAVLDQAKLEYSQGKLPTGTKALINKAGESYDFARDLWLEYRAVKMAGTAATEVETVATALRGAITNLNDVIADLRKLIGGKDGRSTFDSLHRGNCLAGHQSAEVGNGGRYSRIVDSDRARGISGLRVGGWATA